MTGLALYKLLFISEILLAEGLCTYRMKRRSYFPLRVLISLAVCYLAAFFYPLYDVLYTSWYTSIMFLVLFFLTLAAILFCFNIAPKNAFFCATVAYTAQHISYELFKLVLTPFDVFVAKDLYGNSIINFSEINSMTIVVMLVYVEICLVIYVGVYFLIARKLRGGDLRLKNTSILVLSAVILLVDIILNAVIVYIDTDYNKIYDIIVGIYNCLCCLFVFYTLRSIIAVKDIVEELETVSHLLEQAKKQFQIKKEEINLINIKCHDLKHQISRFALKGGLDGDTVDEIKDMISIYDATVKTGNEVIDIIFTEKSLICQSKKINLTCMADCVDINFIGDGELYALFGNILDNAIEAAAQVEEKENRCIDVNIRRAGEFVSIITENYYVSELTFNEDGTPVTLKPDKDYHGFGLKSVKAIVEKYGGNLSISTNDGIFSLKILFPLKSNSDVI